MILLIDVGNTHIVFAIHNDDIYLTIKRVEKAEEISDALRKFSNYEITGVAISSVVPKLTNILSKEIQNILKINPFIVRYENANISLAIE